MVYSIRCVEHHFGITPIPDSLGITYEDADYALNIVKTICTETGPGLPGTVQERRWKIRNPKFEIRNMKGNSILFFSCLEFE